MFLSKSRIRLRCLELMLEYYPDIKPQAMKACLDNMYDYITAGSDIRKRVRKENMSEKKDYKDMFTTWAYWKPICYIIGTIGGLISLFVFATPLILGILAVMFVLGLMMFLLHLIGAMSYESYMDGIKRNYEKLTEKKWDAD